MRMLGAQLVTPVEGDIGPRMLPNGWFLPHLLWGVWFIVARILADPPPAAVITDDIELGKTDCALATTLPQVYH